MEARLQKVRQRKKMKTGLKEDESGEKGTEEAGNLENMEEEKKVEEVVDPNWQRTLRLIEAAKKESSKANREWDVGKGNASQFASKHYESVLSMALML